MTRSRVPARLAALAVSVLLVLGLAEVALRMGGYDPLQDVSLGRAFALRPSSVPGLVYELNPGASGSLWGSKVVINSHGFRDREYEREKPPGVTRIVALGDSITFGNRLPQHSAWPDRLEELYAKEGKAVEVLNLGVGGYDTQQEELLLRELGTGFDPDYVILCYCINDLAIISVNLNTILAMRRFEGWLGRSRVAQWVSLHLEELGESDLLAQLRESEARELAAVTPPADPVLEELRERLLAQVQGWSAGEASSRSERVGATQIRWYLEPARLERVRVALARIADLGARHGFEVLLFVHPYLDEGTDGSMASAWATVYEMVAHQARGVGIRVVDVLDPLRAAGLASLRDKASDAIHPGVRGHAILARTLRRALADLPGLE